MAQARIKLTPHLDYDELTRRYRACKNAKERSRWQAIWLLSRPEDPLSADQVAAVVGFSPDWVRKLARRYNAHGPDGLIDRHRENPGGKKPILTSEQQAKLCQALQISPPEGGIWSGPKVARWIAQETGQHTSAVTGWTYLRKLGYRLQIRRTRHQRLKFKRER